MSVISKTSAYAPGSNKGGKRRKSAGATSHYSGQSTMRAVVYYSANHHPATGQFASDATGVQSMLSTNQTPTTKLTDQQRRLIHQRLRRHYLAEDARLGLDHDLHTSESDPINWMTRLRSILNEKLTSRPSLREAQQL